ncbi:MAG: hypothetical protein AABX70_07440 [Nanoarchaeota archaeon]
MAELNLFPDAPKPPSEAELSRKGPAQISTATSQAVTALGSRLRILEERYTNLRHKTQVTDQNMIELEKGLKEDVKRMLAGLDDMKRELDEVSRRSLQLAEEMRNTVKQSDFKVLQKYLEFWEPLQFVTREEAQEWLGLTHKKQAESHSDSDEDAPQVTDEPKSSLFDQ